jgi:lipopolysaccharide/colanic/teichoic acid biosynthesis glycosyltransferase
MMKRIFDVTAAVLGLLLFSPLMVLTAIIIKRDSPGPIFFRQERMGKGFRPFLIYKFRTMVQDAPSRGGLLTLDQDPRITRAGQFLRRTKIDELPQLINVLKGEMSLVGPRPEVRHYTEVFRQDYEDILKVRPGITDLASIKYRDEAEALAKSGNVEEEYVGRVLPDKIRLAKEYCEESSLFFDLILILRTFIRLAA